jgi:predicted HNH restriction endonuclease
MPDRDQSLPPHVREATSYTLAPNARNISREGTLREARWPTIEKFSGRRNGVLLTNREGRVTRRHLHMLERHGLLVFDTSPVNLTQVQDAARLTFLTAPVNEDDESSYPEGSTFFVAHRRLERDGELPTRAKEKRLAETGELACDVCSFSFTKAYGELGIGFIEAHHTVPVSELAGRRKTQLSELALVCSNCHRMLHRGARVLSVAELREIMRTRGEA